MNKIKVAWAWLIAKCHNSETILLARSQVLVGAIGTVVVATDLSPVISGAVSWKQTAALMAWGVFQEIARKHRAEDM